MRGPIAAHCRIKFMKMMFNTIKLGWSTLYKCQNVASSVEGISFANSILLRRGKPLMRDKI